MSSRAAKKTPECSLAMSPLTISIVQAKVQDIEELVSVGKDLKACPYYGTRQAVPSAQVSA